MAMPANEQIMANTGFVCNRSSSLTPPNTPMAMMNIISKAMPEYRA